MVAWRCQQGGAASSVVVVHMFDGVIEAHFHLFVMIAVAALYQSWRPLLLAFAFIVVHHGVVGTRAPEAVYHHPAATNRPWVWGLVHGGSIMAAP